MSFGQALSSTWRLNLGAKTQAFSRIAVLTEPVTKEELYEVTDVSVAKDKSLMKKQVPTSVDVRAKGLRSSLSGQRG